MDTFGTFKIIKSQVYPNIQVPLQAKLAIKIAEMFTWKICICGWGFFSGSLETKLQFFMGIKTFNSPLQF